MLKGGGESCKIKGQKIESVCGLEKGVCEHNGCKLPKNNYRYLWQFVYTFVGLTILLLREEDFTFFQIFLFTVPILIDIAYSTLESKIMNAVRIVFCIGNAIILVLCMLGLVGAIVDTGSSFAINLEVLNFKFELPKTTMAVIMGPNLAVPLIYFGCSPCRNNEGMLSFLHAKAGKGVAK